jgi:hypothetical protein
VLWELARRKKGRTGVRPKSREETPKRARRVYAASHKERKRH